MWRWEILRWVWWIVQEQNVDCDEITVFWMSKLVEWFFFVIFIESESITFLKAIIIKQNKTFKWNWYKKMRIIYK